MEKEQISYREVQRRRLQLQRKPAQGVSEDAGYALMRNKTFLDRAWSQFEEDREEVAREYAVTDEHGFVAQEGIEKPRQAWTFNDIQWEDRAAFDAALERLLDEPVEVKVYKVSMRAVMAGDSGWKAFDGLDWMVRDPEEEVHANGTTTRHDLNE